MKNFDIKIASLLVSIAITILAIILFNDKLAPGKTLWDWMDLFIIPVVLTGAAWYLKRSDSILERQIAADRIKETRALEEARSQETTLESYVDQLSVLLLRQRLMEKSLDTPVMKLARTRTLIALRRLNSTRRNHLLAFLRDASLLSKGKNSKSLLANADMRNLDLRGAELYLSDLSGADLRSANLNEAILATADLTGAVLTSASLQKASLYGADLSGANLAKANLNKAILIGANLTDADLTEASLYNAVLIGTNLSGADLKGANLQNANLFHADLSSSDLSNLGKYNIPPLTDLYLGFEPGTKFDFEILEKEIDTKVTVNQLKEAQTLKDAFMEDELRKQLIEEGVEI